MSNFDHVTNRRFFPSLDSIRNKEGNEEKNFGHISTAVCRKKFSGWVKKGRNLYDEKTRPLMATLHFLIPYLVMTSENPSFAILQAILAVIYK